MSDIVEVRIEKLVYGGDGLARLSNPNGSPEARQQAIFVPFTLPGELVRVEPQPPRQGRTEAALLAVVQAAPDRVVPKCEYFTCCGGCQLQHITPERQLALKRDVLLETLRRTGGVDWQGEIGLHAAAPWGYRNRIRLQAVIKLGIGYRRRASRFIVPITHCPVASPELNRGLAALSAAPPPRTEEVELAVNNRDQGLESNAPLQFVVAGHSYRVSSRSFFQTNRFLADELLHCVVAGQHGDLAVDLFSGVGLFAVPLAASFSRVIAVESSAAAVQDLRHNGAAFANLRAVKAQAVSFLQRETPVAADLIVADPPRSGLGREACAALLRAAPRRLHLVSCDPATLGRDLGWLVAGGYAIESLDLFDLFPQTYHIETVAKLAAPA